MFSHRKRRPYRLPGRLASLALTGVILATGVRFIEDPADENAGVSAVIVDAADGGIVYEQAADTPRPPADSTRLMALYLAYEGLDAGRSRLSDPLPSDAGHPPATVADGIRALADGSSPRLVAALARRLWGSESAFAEQMSQRARALGMTRSHFVNLTGADDPRQVTTARDVASLVWSLSRDFPQYAETLNRPAGPKETSLLQQVAPAACLVPVAPKAVCRDPSRPAVPGQRMIGVMLGEPVANPDDARALIRASGAVVHQALLGRPVTLAGMPGPAPADAPRPDPPTAPGEGLRIVVIDPRVATSVTSDIPAARAPRAGAPASLSVLSRLPEGAGWTIQVGAYASAAEARNQLKGLAAQVPETLGHLPWRVERTSGGLYRARFDTPAPAAARLACEAVQRAGQPCFMLAKQPRQES